MTETAGVDFSLTKPAPPLLVADGFKFVVGYVSPLVNGQPSAKDLTTAQITAYRAAGLAVAVVFEWTANRALGGAAAGAADGATAKARAAAIGYPPSCVIFAAVDFAVTAAQMPTVLAYLDAFAGAVGHPDGGYGSYALVEALAGRRPGSYRWQTAAWSRDAQGRDQLSSHAHLYQRTAKKWPDVAGTDEDVLCAAFPWFGPAGPTPAPSSAGDDDMKLIQSPTRGTAVVGPGYFKALNAEEATVAAALYGTALQCNDRQFDVARAVCVNGDVFANGLTTLADIRNKIVDSRLPYSTRTGGKGLDADDMLGQILSTRAEVHDLAGKVAADQAPAVDPVAFADAVVANPDAVGKLADALAAALAQRLQS